MITYLGDTNVVFRWATPDDPLHSVCQAAVRNLYAQGDEIVITPQVIIEFWTLATRPKEANGLGLATTDAASLVKRLVNQFPLLPDSADIYPRWLALAETHNVIGRQVYDARLVAVMQTYGVTHLLTFNGSHFRRFSGIVIVDPTNVTLPASSPGDSTDSE